MAEPAGGHGTVGVVLMAYGTPAGPDDVEAYYTHIRRGRPPTPEQVDDLRRRYDAIGGVSPLAARTRAQAAALQAALDQRHPGRFVVALGNKHAAPFIEDAVAEVRAAGVTHAVGLVLAPHYSRLSVGDYAARAEAAGGDDLAVRTVRSWHLQPGLIDLLAARTVAALESLGGAAAGAQVLFTAHSLPERIVAEHDPYPEQLRETAAAVAALAGVERWRTAWQSAGRTPDPWLGPDITDVIRSLPAEGRTGVVVCPAGFVSDHLEVLYDIDVQAAEVAAGVGLPLVRTASLNDDAAFIAVLASVVEAAT